ncbi:MAG: hypothetical protein OXG04_19085 [Acidobacteria bacterium]|nr:hypothetical protein [Acidobacteriota bacterium]
MNGSTRQNQASRVEPPPQAEGLAAELLWAAETKASVVAIVMNADYGPDPSGIADDFGVAVEMALKARLVFQEYGPWENTAGRRAIEEALKGKLLGHNAGKILKKFPREDIEAVKKLYNDSVEEHRQLRLGISGRDVKWGNFHNFIQWVGRAVHERYKSGAPAIILPLGATGTPSFAERLLKWVREPMDQLWSKRTIGEQLKVAWKIQATRDRDGAAAPGPRSRAVRVTDIQGVKVVHEFEVLWHERECDSHGWMTEDGRAWLTNHGSRYAADATELLGRMDAALSSAQGIRRALALMADAQRDAESKEPEAADNEAPG